MATNQEALITPAADALFAYMAASARLRTSCMASPGFHCAAPAAAVTVTFGVSGFPVKL